MMKAQINVNKQQIKHFKHVTELFDFPYTVIEERENDTRFEIEVPTASTLFYLGSGVENRAAQERAWQAIDKSFQRLIK